MIKRVQLHEEVSCLHISYWVDKLVSFDSCITANMVFIVYFYVGTCQVKFVAGVVTSLEISVVQ